MTLRQARVKQALDEGMDAEAILSKALIPAMTQVGKLYESGDYFVPEMLIAARAMKSGLELLRPLLAEATVQAVGKFVTGAGQVTITVSERTSSRR